MWIWIALALFLGLVAGAYIGYRYGGAAVKKAESESAFLRDQVKRITKLSEQEFTQWKARVESAGKALKLP